MAEEEVSRALPEEAKDTYYVKWLEGEFASIHRRFDDIFRIMDQRASEVDRRFGEVDRRFDNVDRRFGDTLGIVNQRFEEVYRRFDDALGAINQRFEEFERHYATKEDLYRVTNRITAIILAGIGIATAILALLK